MSLRGELRLRTWLILLLTTTTVLTFAFVAIIILFFRLPQVEERGRVQAQDAAKNVARVLDQLMAGTESRLHPLAELMPALPSAQLQAYIDAVVGDGVIFQAVYVADAEGRVEALGLAQGQRQAIDELRGADISGSRLFQAARLTRRSNGAPEAVWSDRNFSAISGKNTVALAFAVGDRVLIGETSLARTTADVMETRQDQEVVVAILDAQGHWLASNNPNPDPSFRFFDFSTLPVFQAIIAGKPPPEYTEVFGQRWLAGGVRSEKVGWIIDARVLAGWSNYNYRMTILLIAAGFVGALAISLILAPFWGARMARPIRRLTEHSHRIAGGNLADAWPRKGYIAELNALSDDLRLMVAGIQERETATARSRERLRATLETTPTVAVQWYDVNGKVLYWNKASEKMFGFAADEAVGQTVTANPLMYLDTDQAGDFVAIVQQIERTGESFGPAEFPLRRKDGANIVVLTSVFAIPGDVEGQQLFVSMDTDITERKRAEAALRDNQRQLATIFNVSPVPMSVSDANNAFRILRVNSAWERQFRRQAADVIGKNGAEIGLWTTDGDRRRFLDAFTCGGAVPAMEAWLLAGDGARLLCLVSAHVEEVGGVRLLLMVSVDITDQRRIEDEIRQLNVELEQRVEQRTEELSQANEELEATVGNLRATQNDLVRSEKLAALGGLVAGIAHELNTPVGNALMAVSTLDARLREFRSASAAGLRRSDLDSLVDAVGTTTDITTRNLERAANLVSSFKQVAVDQTSDQRRSFKVAEVVNEIVTTLQPMLKRTPYRIKTKVPAGIVLDSFPGALGQALTNLINNAVVHGFNDRDRGTIRIEAEALPEGVVRLAVRDDGCGIEADRLGRVFDPFYTTRLGSGGSGLGLHITHNAVTGVLGGTIAVTSEVGAGTEFSLLLPRIAPDRTSADMLTANAGKAR